MPPSDISIAAAGAAMMASLNQAKIDFQPRMHAYVRTAAERALARSNGRYTPHHGKNVRYTTDSLGNIHRTKVV